MSQLEVNQNGTEADYIGHQDPIDATPETFVNRTCETAYYQNEICN